MNSTRWQDQFSEEYKRLEQSYKSADSSVSLLVHALENQIIPEKAYLDWALQSYQLPLLKVSYFADHPATTQIWQKWQTSYAWGLHCLPISEWDGHLYVACLEPLDFPVEMKVIPILCPLGGLRQLWQKYQSTMSFELLDLPATTATMPTGESSNFPDEEMLEGILVDTQPVNLGKSDTSEVTMHGQIPSATNIAELVPEPVTSINHAPPKIKPPSTSTIKIVASIAAPIEEYFLGTVEKGHPQKFKEDCSQLFKTLREYFPKSFLLGTDHRLLSVKVIAWDEQTQENKEATPIDLRLTSVFRIVETTQKSFHGPISVNDINSKFFSDWNRQQIPENVTIVPILHNDKVIAMVLCIGDTSHYNRTSLNFAEKAVEEFATQIIPGTKAA